MDTRSQTMGSSSKSAGTNPDLLLCKQHEPKFVCDMYMSVASPCLYTCRSFLSCVYTCIFFVLQIAPDSEPKRSQAWHQQSLIDLWTNKALHTQRVPRGGSRQDRYLMLQGKSTFTTWSFRSQIVSKAEDDIIVLPECSKVLCITYWRFQSASKRHVHIEAYTCSGANLECKHTHTRLGL